VDRSKDESTGRAITGADFLNLDPGEAPAGGLADWLTDRLRAAIADGRLPVGSRLPASRALATELRVSRGVITEAYQRLVEDGHAAGRGRAGTTVVAGPVIPTSPSGPTNETPSVQSGGFPGAGVEAFEVLRGAVARVDLTPGVPDLGAFPRGAWLRAERAVLGRVAPAALGYGDPRGAPAFRAAVARWLARYRGIRVAADDVIVVAGVAQALAMVARVLVADGVRAAAVEDPGSLGARQHLNRWGLETPGVAVDGGGLRVDGLRESGAGAVLLTPAHQFPTGVVLDGGRRRELAAWAESGGLVVEDDYDAEHRYDRPPVPAVRALLGGHACYTGSVSKTLAPALRVGWLLPPRRYAAELVAAKRDADLGSATLPQLVLAELMESGELERQLRLLRRRHRRRRDAMIAAIGTHLPAATVHGAAAGLHLMVTFPDGVDDVAVAADALAAGVKVHPLSWHRMRPGAPGLVLGYAATPPSGIEAGVAALGRVLGHRRSR
jgi:GntR family transcriptional regulator/MocR family aminotransferase